MGRYSTVQAFADTNLNMRKISYEQAAGAAQQGESKKAGVARPDKIENPQGSGSTAGAGSGEFHIYRHARAREMARMQQLDELEEEHKADGEFYTKVAAARETEEQKTERRRKKRQREKEAKLRKKVMRQNGLVLLEDNKEQEVRVEEEFEYRPKCNDLQGGVTASSPAGDERERFVGDSTETVKEIEFKNDGSFLEKVKMALVSDVNNDRQEEQKTLVASLNDK